MSAAAAASSTFDVAAAAEKLKSIVGLDDKNATDLASKPERATDLLDFFAKHNIATDADRAHKVMVYSAWTKCKTPAQRDYVATRVLDGSLQSTQQCDAACRFVAAGDNVDAAAFDAACGVGVTVTKEQITALVQKHLATQAPAALKATWSKTPGALLGQLKKIDALRWADFTVVKDVLDAEVPAIIAGVADEAPAAKPVAAAAPAKAAAEIPVFAPEADFSVVGKGMTRTPLSEIANTAAGTTVFVYGWAHRVRAQAKMGFIVLRDSTAFVQCFFDRRLPQLHRETSVVLVATVKDEPKAAVENQPPKELVVKQWAIVGESHGDFENAVSEASNPDTLFDQRHLVLRGAYTTATMKVRSHMMQAFREHFYQKGLFEVTPPTLVQTQCEGGSTLFDFSYYGEKAYLTQSSQLYLETCLTSIGDVFCILPSFRAEKSKTKRHLSEFTHIEGEYAMITYEDLLTRVEDMICSVFDTVVSRCGDLIAQCNPSQLKEGGDPKDPASWKIRPVKPFVRLTYADAIKKCNELGIENPETGKPFVFGEDITDQPERALVGHIGSPTLMIKFPTSMKSFYMARCADDATLTESVDVLVPGVGEIVGGSMRMWKYEELMGAYAKEGLDPRPYYWYTDQRKYGSVPHGGFGLGLERMLRWMLELDSVKEACLFPRYMGRCEP